LHWSAQNTGGRHLKALVKHRFAIGISAAGNPYDDVFTESLPRILREELGQIILKLVDQLSS